MYSGFPTGVPTEFEGESPSGQPTQLPSLRITPSPSSQPQFHPTVIPSSNPTSSPSRLPTSAPTYVPTSSPSYRPSSPPTSTPSSIPTSTPSSLPTSIPSALPTSLPTSSPSSTPTLEPTLVPTSTPSRKPTRVPTHKPSPSPTLTYQPSLAPSHSYELLTVTSDMRSCFHTCTYPGAPTGRNWTASDYCDFYTSSTGTCPATVVAQYRNASYPACPASCVDSCSASTYCYAYAALSLTCDSKGGVTVADITSLSTKCIQSYNSKAATVTNIAISAGVTFDGLTPQSLSSPTAQQALINTTAASIGGNPDVSIASIQSARRRRRFLLTLLGDWSSTGGVYVLFLVRQRAEALGYSSNTASSAANFMISNLQSSVSSGAFLTTLQTVSQSAGIDTFSDVQVSPSVTAAVQSVTFALTGAPTLQPTASPTHTPTVATSSPTLSPSTSQISTVNTNKKSSNSSTLVIIVVAVVGSVVLTVTAIMYICYCRNHRGQGSKVVGSPSKELDVDVDVNLQSVTKTPSRPPLHEEPGESPAMAWKHPDVTVGVERLPDRYDSLDRDLSPALSSSPPTRPTPFSPVAGSSSAQFFGV
eukprot:gene656-727_t